MGMIYKRGNVWWIKYYHNCKSIRESSKSKSKMVAERFLKRREGEVAQGLAPGVVYDKITFDQLAEGIIQDYKINGKKSLVRVEKSVEYLRGFFSRYKAVQVTTPMINEYVLCRLDSGAANATINRELAALKRMFNLGVRQTPPIINKVPHIPLLKERNARKGFFEHSEFLFLREALPQYLKGFVTFAYKHGWRLEEIASMKWSQVDVEQGIVRLEVGETKNDCGRTVYLDDELKSFFLDQWQKRKTVCNKTPYVFLNRKGDDRVKRFDKTWKKACSEAGVGVKVFHDFRRTAVRNMVRSGIPERVAMMISGHKTRSVFDRYNIVNDQDLKIAAQMQSDYLNSLGGHNLGTVPTASAKN
ncbi:tyrosine-type recombinase/integrase [Desulfogranum marinum]|uniref:tyrosine-type recombinase/integrase n=1 Tax=Desulfogranum marinum TaxID=453220 RepID=UPI00196595C5|nr:site-specific integrase [Desulfogranum marinum]MBM9514718.1 site-specific integrase [Desulfogranum marinum]